MHFKNHQKNQFYRPKADNQIFFEAKMLANNSVPKGSVCKRPRTDKIQNDPAKLKRLEF